MIDTPIIYSLFANITKLNNYIYNKKNKKLKKGFLNFNNFWICYNRQNFEIFYAYNHYLVFEIFTKNYTYDIITYI